MVSDVPAKTAGDPVRMFQSALRFAVVSDERQQYFRTRRVSFQSALRFAVVSDTGNAQKRYLKVLRFQSALRFAVVSDQSQPGSPGRAASRFNPL